MMIVGIVIISMALLVVGAGFYLESRAIGTIKSEFSRLTDGRYRIDAGKVNVSLWRRSVTLDDIEIRPVRVSMTDASTLPKMVFGASVKQLFVTGIKFKKNDGKISIEIRKLALNSPKLKMREFPNHAPFPKDTATVSRPIKININQIILSNGSVVHARIAGNDTIRNNISGVELEIDKFFINSDTLAGANFLGNNTRLTVKKITHLSKDKSTCLEIDSIDMETGKRSLKLSRFAIVPTYGKNEFARKSWRHEDWTRMTIRNIACSGVDYSYFLNKGVLKIETVSVDHGEISSYKNRNIIRDEWVKTLFQQKIQRLPVKMDVGKMIIGNFDAQYEELALGASESGKITFNKLKGKITNLTNIMPADTSYIKIEAAGTVNNSGHFSTVILLPVDSLTNRFEVTATLGTTNLPDLNTMMTPLANVVIDKGIADKLTVRIIGTTTRTTADMLFLYHDLKVTLLRDKNGVMEKQKFLSNIVNMLIIKDSNPGSKGIRTAHTETMRDPYRSPFNFLWRTIYDGLKETVGF